MKQRVEFTDVLGRRVFTILTEPEQATDRLLIMSHGFRGNSTGPAREFVDLDRLLIEDGIACLRFDQPGSGNSEGDFKESSFDLWVDTLVELAQRYLDGGMRVALLGQSMGGSATMVAASSPAIRGRIPAIILWSPGVHDRSAFPDEDYLELPYPDAAYVDEAGERVRAEFWYEAEQAGFFAAFEAFGGAMHLVYGETDRFDPQETRWQLVSRAKMKGHQVTILPGQDHSSWDYDVAQDVYELERAFLKLHLT